MLYLLVTILIPCLLSAAAGGAIVYWYVRSHYEDVTETHDQLLRIEQARAEQPVVSPDDLDALRKEISAQIARVGARVEAIELPPPPDLGPVRQRLDEVAEALQAEVRRIEPPAVDLEPVQAGLRDLAPLPAQVRSLAERLGALEALPTLQRRLDGLDHLPALRERLDAMDAQVLAVMRDRLEGIDAHVREGRKADLETVASGIAALSSTITALRMPDLEPVHAHLRQIEDRVAAVTTDLEPVHAHLRQVESRLDAVPPPPDLEPVRAAVEAIDLAPLRERLVQIEEGLTTESRDRVAVAELADHVARIEEHLGVLSAPSVDLAPLYERLSEIEAGIATVAEPAVDLTPVEERLGRLESGVLDGLHARLVGLEGAVHALRPAPVDLEPLRERLDKLDAAFGELRGAIGALDTPDLAPFIEQVDAIEGRLDLASIESRLTAIEYGLAGVHHTLRARETAVARTTPNRLDRRTPTPAPPRARFDPIDPVRRSPATNRLTAAAFGIPDDLTLFDGVGDPLRDLLHDLGVFYFWQVAEWSDADVEALDPELQDFKGQVVEHDLVAQARRLCEAPSSAVRPATREPSP